jgi:hypothetical protein
VTKTDLLFAVVDDEEPVRTALQRHQLCSTSNRQSTAKHSQTAGTNAAALLMISIHCRDSHPLPLGKNQTFNQGSIPIDETVCSSIILVEMRVKAQDHALDFRELHSADCEEVNDLRNLHELYLHQVNLL